MMHDLPTARVLARQPLDELAGAIQVTAYRIDALAISADKALDFPVPNSEDRAALDRALNLLAIISEQVAVLKLQGEAVEIAATAHKREAA